MDTQRQSRYSDSPVPPWDHYAITKEAESEIHAALEQIDYEGYAIGLYAGYATIPDEHAESESDPFAMCFGYEVGEQSEVYLPEDEETEANKDDPLTDEFLDRLFAELAEKFSEVTPPEAGIVLPRMEITVLGSLQCAGRMVKLCRPGNCSRQTCIGKLRRFNKTCNGWKCQHKFP
jgi:hypothetical protein